MTDDQRKHLEFIQSVITRLAGNSFLVRGWSVTLIAALFALAAKDPKQPDFVILGYFPCFLFAILDALYLSLERKFRALFKRAAEGKVTCFDMTPVDEANNGWLATFFSPTVLIFHGAIALLILGAYLFLK